MNKRELIGKLWTPVDVTAAFVLGWALVAVLAARESLRKNDSPNSPATNPKPRSEARDNEHQDGVKIYSSDR